MTSEGAVSKLAVQAQPIDPPMPYPVLKWIDPDPPRRNFLGQLRRTVDLPTGDYLEFVFRHGNEFSVASRSDFLPRARRLLEVDRIYVVQMIDQSLICTCEVAPAGFIVTARFLCVVQDSCDLLSAGYINVRPWLESYLRRAIKVRVDPPRNTREEARIEAEIRAYFQLKPPDVPGLRVDLAAIEISPANGRRGGA